MRDVSERDRILERLELQVARMPAPVVTASLDATVQRWNPAAAELFGFTEAQAVGQQVDVLLDAPRLGELCRQPNTQLELVTSLTAAGDELQVEWTAVPLEPVVEAGEEVMLIGRDQTARIRAEADRRDALRAARMATWTLDLETMRLEMAEGVSELLGLSAEGVPTLPQLLRLLDSDERRRLAGARRRVRSRAWLRHNFRVSSADGKTSWYVLFARRVGHRVHGNLRDISAEHLATLRISELAQERRKLLERMLLAEEEERGRIAGALHDDTVQLMAALQLNLDRIGVALGGEAPAATTLLAETRSALSDALERTRHLMFELRPQQFDRHGLRYAISALCDQVVIETGMITSVNVTEQRFDPLVEELCYRTVREAVVNARKHSAAEHLEVRVHEGEGMLQGAVVDDGKGFDFERLSRMRLQTHMGLDAMAERLRMADSTCEVRSSPGQGCAVVFTIPLAADRTTEEAK